MCISAFASGNLWQFKIPSGNQTWLAGHALQMEVFMGKSSINRDCSLPWLITKGWLNGIEWEFAASNGNFTNKSGNSSGIYPLVICCSLLWKHSPFIVYLPLNSFFPVAMLVYQRVSAILLYSCIYVVHICY